MPEFLTAESITLVLAMLVAGGITGIAAGLFGIGGGFIVVPALLAIFNFLGVDPSLSAHMAIGTSLATIILTSLRSVYAHSKKKAVDFQILKSWSPWIVLGVLLGLFFASDANGDTLVTVFGLGVLALSVNFLFPRMFSGIRISDHMPGGGVLALLATFLGGISALLGIGGGTIAVLTMTLCGRPIHQAIATAAGFGAIIAIPGAIGFAVMGLGVENTPPGSIGYVNLIGLIAIASTSVLTAPLGASLAHSLPPMTLKRVFGAYLVFTSFLMLKDVMPMKDPTDTQPEMVLAPNSSVSGGAAIPVNDDVIMPINR